MVALTIDENNNKVIQELFKYSRNYNTKIGRRILF